MAFTKMKKAKLHLLGFVLKGYGDRNKKLPWKIWGDH